MRKKGLLFEVLLICMFYSTINLWSQNNRHLAIHQADSSSFYITTQQQHFQFKDNFRLHQSGIGIKLKEVDYTLISNLQYAYGQPKTGWQLNNEFYYTPKGRKNYQYGFVSLSNAVWFPKFVGALSNFYIGIKNLEIENGLKLIILPDQNDIWLLNTGFAYALKKNLFTAKWVYLYNGISNNDFILGYRYYFNENSIVAFNILLGSHNLLLDFNNIPISLLQRQKYYGFNINSIFSIFNNGYLVLNYTYNHFYDKTAINNWNLNIASIGLNYKIN